MKDFLTNSLVFPGRAPKLNTRHFLYSPSFLGLAAVAQPSGGMIDLVSGATATNTLTATEFNEIGPCVYSTGLDSSAYLTWPYVTVPGGTNVTFITISGIFKFIASGTQYLLNFATNSGVRISSNSFQFLINNGVVFNATGLLVNHSYYFCVQNAVATAGGRATVALMDITSGGKIFSNTQTSGNSWTQPLTWNVLQLNDANTGPVNRLAALSISYNTGVPPVQVPPSAYPSFGDITASLYNPWSLWYDGPSIALALGLKTPSAAPPATGALNIPHMIADPGSMMVHM